MMFKVVRGNPTPEELAAALAVVCGAAGTADAAAERAWDEWADNTRNIPRSAPPQPGPVAWRSSCRPR